MSKEGVESHRRVVVRVELEEIFEIAKSLGMIVHVIESDDVMVEIEVTRGLTDREWRDFLQAKIDEGSGWCG